MFDTYSLFERRKRAINIDKFHATRVFSALKSPRLTVDAGNLDFYFLIEKVLRIGALIKNVNITT